MKRDYPELEGKELIFITYYGEEIPAIVIGCNYDIGVTIVRKNNPKEYLSCLIGDSAPNNPGGWTEEQYKRVFNYYVKSIEEGYYDVKEASEMKKDIIGLSSLRGPSADDCAFNQ